MTRIAERMTKNPACCKASDNLAMAANLLWQNDCGCVPVVDENDHVQGMITDRDICMAAFTTGKRLAELLVGEAMARDVASIGVMDSLLEAELTMRTRAVHRLPVVDAQHRLIGMLCCNDLLRWADDGGANGSTTNDAVHLVRTLATIGRSRTAVPAAFTPGAAEAARTMEPRALGAGLPIGEPVPPVASRREAGIGGGGSPTALGAL